MTLLVGSSAAPSSSKLQRLVSCRTGIVRTVSRLAAAGDAASAWLAELADPGVWSSVAMGNPTTAGAYWQDEPRAIEAALGEAAERYCGMLIPSGLRTATARHLRHTGERVLSGNDLALHSPSQHEQPGFPFVLLDDETEAAWVPAEDAQDGSRVFVPASVVYLGDITAHYAVPATNYPVGAGIAAGLSREQAIEAALGEAVERHALATAWARGAPFPAVEIPPAMSAAGRLAGVETVDAWAVPNTFNLPVLLVSVSDAKRDLIGFGCALRETTVAAMWKAFSEALLSLQSAQALDDPAHPIHELTSAGRTPLKPHRQDRQYRRDYAEDWRDVTDIACHAQLLLDPIVQRAVMDRLATPGSPTGLPIACLGSLRQLLGRQGRRILVVDVTSADIRMADLHVARVIVPGLRATAPAAFPFLGGHDFDGENAAGLCTLPVPLA